MEAQNASVDESMTDTKPSTANLAKTARDEFIGAWEELEMRGVYSQKHTEMNKWDYHGDELAHINHVALDDDRGQELKADLIRRLRNRAADMNRRVSEKVAPLEELDILLSRAEQENNDTEDFDFEALEEGDTVEVTVEARNGELMEDEVWTDELEFTGKQNLSAQSRCESWGFKHTEKDRTTYIRYSALHKNNFGFIMSREDKSDVDYDAMWQDIMDDRDWKVKGIERSE